MTSYEAAESLRHELRLVGIDESWIREGGVSIQCFRHEVKKTMRVINKLRESLDYVSLFLTIKNHNGNGEFLKVDLIRKQGQKIEVNRG